MSKKKKSDTNNEQVQADSSGPDASAAAAGGGATAGAKSSSKELVIAVVAVIVIAVAAAGYVVSQRKVGTPEELFEEGLAALEERHYGKVQYVVLQMQENYPAYGAHVHYLQGAARLKIGYCLEAIEDLHEAARHEDLKVDAMVLAGEALARSKDYPQAVQIIQRALVDDPDHVDAHRWLGIIAFDTGAMEQAVNHLSKVSELAPEDARPHRLMGLIMRDYERFDEAITHYEEAIRRNPYYVEIDEVRFELAQALVAKFRYADAIEVLDQTRPTSNAYYLRAKCLRSMGLADRAIEALDITVKQNPRHADGLVLYGTMLLEKKDYNGAIEKLKRAVELKPKEDIPRYRLAEAYRESGDTEKAEAELAIYQPLREMRLKYSKLNVDAIQQPENMEIRYELGSLALQLDRPKLAKMWFETVLAVEPDHVKARTAIMQLPPDLSAAPKDMKLDVQEVNPIGTDKGTQPPKGTDDKKEPAQKEPAQKESGKDESGKDELSKKSKPASKKNTTETKK